MSNDRLYGFITMECIFYESRIYVYPSIVLFRNVQKGTLQDTTLEVINVMLYTPLPLSTVSI
jgi:hypothetical protein